MKRLYTLILLAALIPTHAFAITYQCPTFEEFSRNAIDGHYHFHYKDWDGEVLANLSSRFQSMEIINPDTKRVEVVCNYGIKRMPAISLSLKLSKGQKCKVKGTFSKIEHNILYCTGGRDPSNCSFICSKE